MRLHLTIQRHGLPVTRILWTTSPPSLLGPNPSSIIPAASSAVTSSRMPNALYANGGYTIAQLLEDVNEVIPLETEPRVFEDESSGQWGLEDYAVEVGGSECLHFMELEGILRDGDEVLIRALQMSDLKARRISGRHQISADGKHLIDGVPFGKPFLKRPTSSRPAITIPPRKKRRTTLALWGSGSNYEDEDADWAPRHIATGKELSLLKPESKLEPENADEYEDAYQDDYEDFHEPNEDVDGTVIRHHIDETSEASASDDEAASEVGDLSQELEDLKKDMDAKFPGFGKPDKRSSLRSRQSTLQAAPTKSSLSRRSTLRPSDSESVRGESKSVTFDKQNLESPATKTESSAVRAGSTSEEPEHSASSDSDSDSSASDTSDTSASDSSDDSSSGESEAESVATSESSSDSDSDSSSESSASESESEAEEDSKLETSLKPVHQANPPGEGSERTRKSNQRAKMRRRLTKLKQMGFLDEQADFDALREFDRNEDSRLSGGNFKRKSLKEQEQETFEAKRQKLLRDLESGGIDVSFVSEKENMSPKSAEADISELPEEPDSYYETANDMTPVGHDLRKRRSLDVASTRRLLFGSLGVRNPRSKEEEEATRKKLAGKVRESVSQPKEEELIEIQEAEPEVDWREKLVIGATECIYDDIELSAPPFPFEQHWDADAGVEIRRRNKQNKKRKRREQLQVYEVTEDTGADYYAEDDVQLNYDDFEQPEAAEENEQSDETTKNAVDTDDDLPDLPEDTSDLPDLTEKDLKPGLVFAFKQLDVSKATNWQPMVSDYRIAVISEVFDDNILNIQLAKPFRRQPKDADAEGPFNYSGFEMPGMDDEEGIDDGFREVPLDDLIEPKLLRAAPAGVEGEAVQAFLQTKSTLRKIPAKRSSMATKSTTPVNYRHLLTITPPPIPLLIKALLCRPVSKDLNHLNRLQVLLQATRFQLI
ncbi:hypothetical protein BDV18DRAFT_68283 [Aspergillus unguis]